MSFDVKIDGLARLVNQLEKFDKDVSKELKQGMKQGAADVARAARALVPDDALRNWGAWTYSKDDRDLGYIGSWVKRGIVAETERSRNSGITVGFGYRVVSKSAAGAIYELAGSRSDEPMPRAMNRKRPVSNYPRTLFPAYYAAMPGAREKIEEAIKIAERKVGR